MKQNYIGDIIFAVRGQQNLTQDKYGARYQVSGPAVFKFEKGYVKPSLVLWLKIAADAGLSEHRAVLLWCKAKLPESLQQYIEMQSASAAEAKDRPKKKALDYTKCSSRQDLLQMAGTDAMLPPGLKTLLEDDELWALYQPSGKEVNLLRDSFGPLGRGTAGQYREALALIREFRA